MSTNKTFLSILLVLMLTGCSSSWFTHNNGNMPTAKRVDELQIGLSKEEVKETLGIPSNVISLDKNTWIYMSSKTERIAFLNPKEIERDILIIRFDKWEQVDSFEKLTLEDGKEIKISKNKTPSLGKKPGFFEKYFGGAQYNPLGNIPK